MASIPPPPRRRKRICPASCGNCTAGHAAQFGGTAAGRGLPFSKLRAHSHRMSERIIGSAAPVPAASLLQRLRGRMASPVRRLWCRIQRHRQRASLAGLDERMLKDIGTDRLAIWRESQKWWWQN